MAKLNIFLPIFLLAVFVKQGESVRCWSCSSDLDPMCNDPFFPAGRTSNSYVGSSFPLENCDANTGATYPYLTSSKSACKKVKKYVRNELVIIRGCIWKRQDDYSNMCPSSSNGPNEVTSYCETCEFDGCNGAATVGKALALLMAPLLLVVFK